MPVSVTTTTTTDQGSKSASKTSALANSTTSIDPLSISDIVTCSRVSASEMNRDASPSLSSPASALRTAPPNIWRRTSM